MKLTEKIKNISLNLIPIICMIILIPFFRNDYILLSLYILIIAISFFVKYEEKEYVLFVFGFFIMTVSEYFFVSTNIETFTRNTLFGVMPIWLPLLWAYVFVAIRRAINIID
jgi:hypothetical protein